MKKPSAPFWISVTVILLALSWALFPEHNLEPLIVLLVAFIGIYPLIKNEVLPWLEGRKLKNKKFKFLCGFSKINAIVPEYKELFEIGEVQLNLLAQRFNHYPVRIIAFFEQTDFRFKVGFNTGKSIEIKQCFGIGYEVEGEREFRLPKKSNQYIIAQFDIDGDGDGIDEFILGVIDGNSVLIDVQLTIYKYYPPLFEQDLERVENLKYLGTIKAQGIVGAVNIELKKGSITIPRHHRGFYYKWAFVNSQLIDIGNY